MRYSPKKIKGTTYLRPLERIAIKTHDADTIHVNQFLVLEVHAATASMIVRNFFTGVTHRFRNGDEITLGTGKNAYKKVNELLEHPKLRPLKEWEPFTIKPTQ